MSPPAVWLHVGMHKTGTTGVQTFLAANRDILLQHGILYPTLFGGINHPELALCLPNRREEMIRTMRAGPAPPPHEWPDRDTAYRQLAAEIAVHRPGRVVLSTECFLEWLDPVDVRDSLAECVGGPVTVLVYLRNPVDWIEAVYRQVVRDPEIRFAGDPAELPQWDLLDYGRMLGEWSRTFGEAALQARSYDSVTSGGEGVVADLAVQLGVADDSRLVQPPRDTNMAPSAAQARRLQALNARRLPFEEHNEAVAQVLSRSYPSGEPGPAATLAAAQADRWRAMIAEVTARWLPAGHRIDVARGVGPAASMGPPQTEATPAADPDPAGTTAGPDLGAAPHAEGNAGMSPTVAVITRTKDRPLMLSRVVQSLLKQTYRDFLWVLVNDAGDPEPVADVAVQGRALGLEVMVVNRARSVGMEAASNDGIRHCDTPYVVIHDDDDSWEPGFLAQTVQHLRAHPEAAGVITWSTRVDEVLHQNFIEIVNRYPYNHGLLGVYLADQAIANRFPPISFLFTRRVYDEVGGFDESLPVLGDWDFSLRALLVADIHVIPEPLANYHFRVGDLRDEQYGNTVTHQKDRHAFYDVAYHNRLLREEIRTGTVGLGHLLAAGLAQRTSRTDRLLDRLNAARRARTVGELRRVLRS